jgi:hypothetical protein
VEYQIDVPGPIFSGPEQRVAGFCRICTLFSCSDLIHPFSFPNIRLIRSPTAGFVLRRIKLDSKLRACEIYLRIDYGSSGLCF